MFCEQLSGWLYLPLTNRVRGPYRKSTSFTRAISVLRPIILPLQTFFSRVLLLRQQAFSWGNSPRQADDNNYCNKNTSLPVSLRSERVNSTRKLTIVVEIVSLLKKIYKRDAPFRAVFKEKALAVMFPPYPAKWKQIPRNLNLLPFCRLLFSMEMGNPFPHALYRARVV